MAPFFFLFRWMIGKVRAAEFKLSSTLILFSTSVHSLGHQYSSHANAKTVCHNTCCRLIKKDSSWLDMPYFYSSQSLGTVSTGSSRRRQVVLGTSLNKKQCISSTCVTGDDGIRFFKTVLLHTKKFPNKYKVRGKGKRKRN